MGGGTAEISPSGGTTGSCGLLDRHAMLDVGVKLSVCTGSHLMMPGWPSLAALPGGPRRAERAEELCCFVQATDCAEVLACMRFDASSPCELDDWEGRDTDSNGLEDLDLVCTSATEYEVCMPLRNGMALRAHGDCSKGQDLYQQMPGHLLCNKVQGQQGPGQRHSSELPRGHPRAE